VAQTRDLVVRILADTTKLNSGMDTANNKLGGLGKAAKIAGGAFAAFAAADVVTDFLGDSAKAAEEDKKSQAELARQLKVSTGATEAQIAAVEDSIGALSRASGVADDDLRPAYAALARATGDTETAQDELALAMDIAAARGVDLETVTTAMEKAHNGNTGALGRLGVATKDAEGNTLSLEQAMAGAQKTYEGAAEAAVTPAERMKVAWSEMQEQIGTALLPVLENLSKFMADTLLPAVQDVVEWVQEHWPEIQKAIQKTIDIVQPILETLFTFVKTQFQVIKGIIEVFAALLRGDFSAAWEAVKETVNNVWEGIKTIVSNAIDFVKGVLNTLWDVTGDAITGAVNAAISFFETAINKGIDLINMALDLLDKAAGPWVDFDEVGHVKFGRIGGGAGAAAGTGVTAGATTAVKMAAGGIVTRPTLALIGESGPEAVVPLGRGGMGMTFNISNVNVTANNAEEMVASLNDYARRNGGLRVPGGVTAVS